MIPLAVGRIYPFHRARCWELGRELPLPVSGHRPGRRYSRGPRLPGRHPGRDGLARQAPVAGCPDDDPRGQDGPPRAGLRVGMPPAHQRGRRRSPQLGRCAGCRRWAVTASSAATCRPEARVKRDGNQAGGRGPRSQPVGARPTLTCANAARAGRTIVRQPNAHLQARHSPSVTDQGGLRAEPGRTSPRSRGGHRLGLKGPVDGLAADAEQAGDLGHGVLAVRVQLAGVVDLPGGEAGLASSDPAAGAGRRPSLVPSTMTSRWNSSRAPRRWKTSRPLGVVVSICCLSTTRPMPRWRRASARRAGPSATAWPWTAG